MSGRKKALLLAVVSAMLAPAAAAAGAMPAQPHLIPGSFTQERQPDGNSIIFEDANGLVVVDTGRHRDHQDKILAYASKRDKPIRIIVNTHWHLDHSGGNAELRAVYPEARLYASRAVEAALDAFLARGLERGRARLADPAAPDAEKAETRLNVEAVEDRKNLLPDVVVAGPTEIDLLDRKLLLHLAPRAATEGDIWIYDPATATLVAGDLVVVPAPFFDTACPEGWSRALAEIAAVPFETLVPGHGRAMSRPEFAIYRTAFDNLVACAASDAAGQACIDGWQRDAAAFLVTEQDRRDAQMLLDYYFGEILRSAEKKAEHCGQ